jgi:exodeoxyribonuclease VII small subunit
MDFEKRLNRLEEIVGKMETGELPLEESLKLFEEGVKLSRDCNSQLSEAAFGNRCERRASHTRLRWS